MLALFSLAILAGLFGVVFNLPVVVTAARRGLSRWHTARSAANQQRRTARAH